jgi:hypothetical protein
MSSNNKDQTSTLQSYVDSATGAVQSALGSLTGSTADKVRLPYLYYTPLTNLSPGPRREQEGHRSRGKGPLPRNRQSRPLRRLLLRRCRKRQLRSHRRLMEPERRCRKGSYRRLCWLPGPQAGGSATECAGQGTGGCWTDQ